MPDPHVTCLHCRSEPAKISGRRLCQRCYSQLRRDGQLYRFPDFPEPVFIPVPLGWLDKAECRGSDPDMFYDSGRFREAVAVCAACPVVAGCRGLADACETSNSKGYVWGVFGGETASERIARRKGKTGNGSQRT